jgi:hypothetical protein
MRAFRTSIVVGLVGLGVWVGCGGAEPKPPASARAPTTTAPPATTIASTAAPVDTTTMPSTSTDSAAAKPEDVTKKATHWTAYAGPKMKATALTTKQVWAVVPVGYDFGLVKIALETYGAADGDEQRLDLFDKTQLWVPAALVKPAAKATALAKGDAVMVNVAAASGFGRVTAMKKGDDGVTMVSFRYTWGSSVSESELPLDEVIRLDDKIAFGGPVATKEEDGRWGLGQVIYTDAKETWVITLSGPPAKVATKDVVAMKVAKPFTKGAKVSSYGSLGLEPGKVVEVLEDGLRYKIKHDSGKEETMSFDRVTAPM